MNQGVIGFCRRITSFISLCVLWAFAEKQFEGWLKRVALLLLALLFLAGCTRKLSGPAAGRYDFSRMDKTTTRAYLAADAFLQDCIRKRQPVYAHKSTRIDTIVVDPAAKTLAVKFSATFAQIPFREDNTGAIYAALQSRLGKKFRDFHLSVFADHQLIEQLIPNFYRTDTADYDRSRLPKADHRGAPIVRNISKTWQPAKGLFNRNIALWPSHGWYYEDKLKRWEWQRARVYQTVEDLLPFAFVQPYLLPMLENAGANVFIPRERDIQTNMVIIDNDSPLQNGIYRERAKTDSALWFAQHPGFVLGKPPYRAGDHPFAAGSHRWISASAQSTAQIQWIPDIPETGEYAVYIAYSSHENSVDDAHYTVFHSGGQTEFRVNQRIGGNTWIYLGAFHFPAGMNDSTASVLLTNESKSPENRIVSADAVRFGGGMGDVSRNGRLSGRPRFMEGARYYLQFSGMPDTLIYNVTEDPQGDYKDDYRSRGEWVNYLRGAPFGPNKQRDAKGLGIPIDLSLAFHTDAGSSPGDTTIGTLMIVSITDADSAEVFPDSVSRLANRDFGDILQTQIVDDIRAKYDPVWRRRALWNRRYSEAFRPNVPAALLELLSHHNFLDMKFALDPRFRFDVSRSIYKGMLKFLATEYGHEYVIQPLPVTHFCAEFSGENGVNLRWRTQADSLEPTAVAEKFMVYTRIAGSGWDNGVPVDQPNIDLANLQPGVIYSYKVTAVNAGGESFPSEILSVCRVANANNPVLIINGFDRTSAPATLESGELRGFANFWDQGVPDRYDLNFIGDQYDFDDGSDWLDDDSPGHGASHADFETKIIPGNTHDFPYLHGQAVRAAGYSFVSASDEAVMDSLMDLSKYRVIDLILGEEKSTEGPKPRAQKQFVTFPSPLQKALTAFLQKGGRLFASGAYIGTDLFVGKAKDHPDRKFARETLKFNWRTNYAAKTGKLISVDSTVFSFGETFQFNTGYHRLIYTAESPDAIEPNDSLAITLLRYAENNTSAAVAYAGDYKLVLFGFPFETVLNEKKRTLIMQKVLEFFQTSP